MRIYIPSYKRANKLSHNLSSLSFIPPSNSQEVFLVLREEEKEEYTEVLDRFKCGAIYIQSSHTAGRFFGWGETMDWILDHVCSLTGLDECVIMDDDLKMAYRPTLENIYTPLNEERWYEFIDRLSEVSCDIPIMSGIARQFSQEKKKEYADNARVNQLYALHLPTFRQHPELRFARYSGMKFMTDYFFVLSSLQAGIRNRVWNRFTRDDVPDAKGGCSEFRTVEEHSASAVQLCKHFPGLVTLRQKTNWGDVRIGVTIRWSKAYKEKT